MSSSYKAKKQKTLATRKRTQKRRNESQDEVPVRFHQPPHLRDARWKGNCHDLPDVLGVKEADDETDVSNRNSTSAIVLKCTFDPRIKTDTTTLKEEPIIESKSPLEKIFPTTSTLEQSIDHAIWYYKKIRQSEHQKRHKSKIIILMDSKKNLKQLPTQLGAVKSKIKKKSRLGIGSESKSIVDYRGIGFVWNEQDNATLEKFQNGQITTILSTINSIDHWKSTCSLLHYIIQIIIKK